MAKAKVELNKKILVGPRITEKAVIGADKAGVYVFNVTESSTKQSIAAAIKEAYKVTPEKVRVVNMSNSKKAYIYLKKGDKIEVV
ncbi:MAG: 50S ribosomal protein L23 [Candidatus Zambryskibacteria bacterium RIFCSPHIGHO2_01_FULL_44_22b]|uniref:50S ribosomal protein L23 n=2 Tax=Candidatus Zambryskiibacteriota TaxID=1817925 RepID=A0A1G2SY59_9BACT|nr:MAG: 50S ribosomal protein L23 [Candidatus Zambryskibacteria bacterium RIFCSPHIGHO2_01_FULL_44_22b]OHB05569.1 MAG: 50S ribosomal protein L23 [Candidatus Zambryskibacteria bacterium RIFCSPLOWO2_01_FULL_45_43]